MRKVFLGAREEVGRRDYAKALIDSSILAAGAFFGSITAEALIGDARLMLVKASISAATVFFATLAASLGIRKP